MPVACSGVSAPRSHQTVDGWRTCLRSREGAKCTSGPHHRRRSTGPSTSLRTGKWQVSNSGGSSPQWSKTGDLIYQSGDQILAARYTVSGDTFVPDKPRVWIAKYAGTDWDLAPDGTRIVALMPVEGRETPKADNGFVFLEHFFDELRRRAPLPR